MMLLPHHGPKAMQPADHGRKPLKPAVVYSWTFPQSLMSSEVEVWGVIGPWVCATLQCFSPLMSLQLGVMWGGKPGRRRWPLPCGLERSISSPHPSLLIVTKPRPAATLSPSHAPLLRCLALEPADNGLKLIQTELNEPFLLTRGYFLPARRLHTGHPSLPLSVQLSGRSACPYLGGVCSFPPGLTVGLGVGG